MRDETTRLGGPFWWLLTASGLSNLADGVVKIVLPLVALGFTQSPGLVAGLTLAFTLPWLLFALPAGALADRLDRRRAMLGANVVRTALAAVLVVALATDLGSIGLLYVIAFLLGTTETLYDTAAQSILPQLVPGELVARANARLYLTEMVTNNFVGPPLGGLLVALGAVLAFSAPVALWLVAVGALLLVRGSFRVERERSTSMVADIREGLGFLRRDRLLLTLAIMTGVSNFASNGAFAVFVVYAVGPSSAMKLTEPGYGLLITATALGAVLGSLVAERIERRLGRPRAMAVAVVGTTILLATPGFTASPWLIGIAFAIGGATVAVWNVIVVSLRQRRAPAHLLGRVNSAYRLVAWGTMPLGAAFAGAVGEVLGLPAVFLIAGALSLALLALVPLLREPPAASALP